MAIQLEINGKQTALDAPGEMPLLWALRDLANLTGTKYGCGMALCGACTVHVDGAPVRACVTPVSSVQGKPVTTIEGVGNDAVGRAVQAAWQELDVVQCGYCQSGQIMSAVALLGEPCGESDADVREAMSGNLCRCGAYKNILAAVRQARRGIA